MMGAWPRRGRRWSASHHRGRRRNLRRHRRHPGVKAVVVNAEMDTGVPWCSTVDDDPVTLLLKSGNFGKPDLPVRAATVTELGWPATSAGLPPHRRQALSRWGRRCSSAD